MGERFEKVIFAALFIFPYEDALEKPEVLNIPPMPTASESPPFEGGLIRFLAKELSVDKDASRQSL